MPADLWIRPAVAPDFWRVIGLLNGVRQWLADDRKTDQWQYQVRRDEGVERDIAGGTLYLVWDGVHLVATITLDRFADTDFWTPDSDNQFDAQDALYVHRMAVARDYAGRQIGSAMLDWAGRTACGQSRSYLRLDAWRTNTELHKYYQRQGFDHVGLRELAHRGSGALFQRSAAYQNGEGPVLVPARDPARDAGQPSLASPHG